MSYTALYRKWRPVIFDDVKGQDAIVTTLKNQITADRIGHAYLFCGTRGTGKTSVAKIFAKAVNCVHPVNGNPCGECETCRSIARGSSMNVIEIDAASNNSVEDIRKIREEVQYSPTEGRYKVYIIDEVHMLSMGAFNALLKTLEEPPSYVIFILATTETHKIPVTIMSRCQRYDFRRISIETITGRLRELADAENINVEERALEYIARTSDGALRDALSLLDQCIAFYFGQDLKYDDVLQVLGAVDTEILSKLLRLVLETDTTGCIELLEELIMQGRDLGKFVTDFVWYLRNLLLVKTASDARGIIDMSEDNFEALKEDSRLIDDNTLMRYIRIFSELSNDLKYSSQKRILVEVALIKLTKPAMEQSEDMGDILSRLTRLEEKLENGVSVNAAALYPEASSVEKSAAGGGAGADAARKDAVRFKEDDEASKRAVLQALPEDIKQAAAQWNSIISDIGDGALEQMLKKAKVSVSGDNAGIEIMISSPSAYSYINRAEQIARIETAIEQRTQKHIDIRVRKISDDRDARNMFTDIRELVRMDIEIDDNREELI